jgi:hypothetical protein
VASVFPMQDFFAERIALSQQGAQLADAEQHHALRPATVRPTATTAGTAPTTNNFAPRGGFAYTPDGGFLEC